MGRILGRMGLATGGVALVAGAVWAALWWGDRRSLETARSELAAGRYASARERLASLSAKRPGRGEVELPLGNAEQAAGRIVEATAAWSRVPAEAPEFPEAALKLSQVRIDQGRLADAEDSLRKALERPSTRELDLRQLLIQILWQEGRLEEARKLIEKNYVGLSEAQGPASPMALLTLHGLLALDFETYPLDQSAGKLADLAGKNPDDDRIALGRAILAIRAGRLDEAKPLLATCLERRPDDPAVWRAKLDLAMGLGSLEGVEEAVGRLTTGDLPRPEGHAVAAWIARKRNDPAAERRAWETLLSISKGNSTALERLAELDLATGQTAKALEIRKRKAVVDEAKKRYRDLLQSDYKATAPELLRLSERLDRIFDAFAFHSIASNRKPSEMVNHPMYGRVGRVGADPILVPGQPLAEFLALNLIVTPPERTRRADDDRGPTPRFEERAKASGLYFSYLNGRSILRQLPETMSGGLAVLDFDGDGWLDIFCVQGGPTFPMNPSTPHEGDRLFRNKRDGTFEDVTARAQIPRNGEEYGIGVTVGDFDNDGRPDLFLTRWNRYTLLRNAGDGRFEDVTAKAGLGGDRDWPTSAAFADLDNDGDLDLYVDHYLEWDPTKPRPCRDAQGRYSYCDPRLLPALPDHLFRNDGGKFVEITKEAGIIDKDGRGLGVLAADLNDDGLVDLFVANDGTSNYLFGNRGGLKFEEVGLSSGVAGNAEGGFQAGMGVAFGDLDNDERPDLVVTNFYGESTTFYQNLGGGMFGDRSSSVGLSAATRTLLGFGISLFDANNDGYLDLASANGHVNDFRPVFPYAMPSQLLLGSRSGRLKDASESAGTGWTLPRVGRGLAQADLNNDGRMDVLILPQDDPILYLQQSADAANPARSLTLHLEGTKSNRDAIGASVRVRAGGRTQVAQRFGGGSYQSSGDPRLHFGLGKIEAVEEAEVRWPSGRIEKWTGLKPGGYRLKEGDPGVKPLPGF